MCVGFLKGTKLCLWVAFTRAYIRDQSRLRLSFHTTADAQMDHLIRVMHQLSPFPWLLSLRGGDSVSSEQGTGEDRILTLLSG